MLKNLDTPSIEEIHAYQTWMEKCSPLDHMESLFLSRKTDLLSLTRQRRSTIVSTVGGAGAGIGSQSASIGLPLILVLPLMAFAVVPGLLGRLFMLVLFSAAEVMLVTSTELMDLMSVRQWVAGFSV